MLIISTVAAVVEAITTGRNCSFSSSSSNRSCGSRVVLVSVFLRFLSQENSITLVMEVIIAKIYFRTFSEYPITSDATAFTELQCFDALS